MKNFKRALTFLLALALSLTLTACGIEDYSDPNLGNPDYSDEYTEGLNFEVNSETNEVVVKGYDGSATEIVIPRIYKGKYVTEIWERVFDGSEEIVSISFPDTLKVIGAHAFAGCAKLSKINIPKSVVSIGTYIFNGCLSLTSITVEEGNPVYHSNGNCIIETASKTLVAGCKSSVIPTDGSVTAIGLSAFSGMRTLDRITIPEGITTIGRFAFWSCSGLKSITMPNSLESIRVCAFKLAAIDEIFLSAGIRSIERSAFENSGLSVIHYAGTKAQWESIEFEDGWDQGTGKITVHCTDGDVVTK